VKGIQLAPFFLMNLGITLSMRAMSSWVFPGRGWKVAITMQGCDMAKV